MSSVQHSRNVVFSVEFCDTFDTLPENFQTIQNVPFCVTSTLFLLLRSLGCERQLENSESFTDERPQADFTREVDR